MFGLREGAITKEAVGC